MPPGHEDAWALGAGVLIDTLVKGVLILCLAALVDLALRQRGAASMRHFIWLTALMWLVALPVFTLITPSWRPATTPIATHSPITADHVTAVDSVVLVESAANLPTITPEDGATPLSSAAPLGVVAVHWTQWLVMIWMIGVVVALLPMLAGLIGLSRLTRRATLIDSGTLAETLVELHHALGMARFVRAMRSDQTRIAMTWGWRRPLIIVPQETDHWPREKVRAVLIHELAHAKRMDWLSQWIARLICAFNWFNPLAWWAAKRMRVERELACDDLVVAQGVRASDYAEHLLGFAREARMRWWTRSIAVGIVQACPLEKRLTALLDPDRRRSPLTPWIACALLILTTIGFAPLTTMTGSSTNERRVDPSAAADHTIMVNTRNHWQPLNIGGPLTTGAHHVDTSGPNTVFTIFEPDRRVGWYLNLEDAIDAKRYPLLTLTYRANNTHPTDDHYALYLHHKNFGWTEGIEPALSRDLIADGQVHQIIYDMRDTATKTGRVKVVMIGVTSGETSPAEFELIDLRFAGAENWATPAPAALEPITIRVLDVQGEPIEAARVTVDTERTHATEIALTDANGWAIVQPPKPRPGGHSLRIEKPGMLSVEIRAVSIDDVSRTVTMRPGLRYGGRVVDEQGRPISGAVVKIDVTHPRYTDRPNPMLLTGPDGLWSTTVLTGSDGFWRSPLLPDDLTDLSVSVDHRDYVGDWIGHTKRSVSIENLRTGVAELVMRRGVDFTCRVVDEHGQPLEDAWVMHEWIVGCRLALGHQTASDGVVRFTAFPEGRVTLTAKRSGYAPQLLTVDVQPEMSEVVFELQPSPPLRVQVVDVNGTPWPGLMVWVSAKVGDPPLRWGEPTDEQGRFTWDWAPPQPVAVSVSLENTVPVKVWLTPGDEEHTVQIEAIRP